MEQYEKLCVAVTLAKSYGYIDYGVPIRQYNYDNHYHNHNHNHNQNRNHDHVNNKL